MKWQWAAGPAGEQAAAASLTRVVHASAAERQWAGDRAQQLACILGFVDHKTVWHPKGR